MDEKSLDELMQMSQEERWKELLNDADEAIREEEDRIKLNLSPKKDPDKCKKPST
jgi:hypothetical protein